LTVVVLGVEAVHHEAHGLLSFPAGGGGRDGRLDLVVVAEDAPVERRGRQQLLVRPDRGERPLRISSTRSAWRICESRWVISSVVRPSSTRRIAVWILSSVALSMALVESSRMRMRGSVISARAMARRWRCPPESVTPRSPMTVS